MDKEWVRNEYVKWEGNEYKMHIYISLKVSSCTYFLHAMNHYVEKNTRGAKLLFKMQF